MALDRQEREELVNLYAQMKRGGEGWSPSEEDRKLSNEQLELAIWSAMCHTTGRCGMAVDAAHPGTPQARIYQLLMKALQE